MAQLFAGFFDGTEVDPRSYVADKLAALIRTLATDGVAAIGTNLQVIPDGDNMKTRILPGSAIVRGYLFELIDDGGAPYTLTHAASGVSPRIDRVILRLNLATEARTITLALLQGTPSASPAAPALTRTDTVYELSLAQVLIPASVAAIEAGHITDERGNEAVCGAATPHVLKLSLLPGNHVHALATAATAGFMAAADKQKLDERLGQAVNTNSSPTFAGMTVNGQINNATFA